MSIHRKDQADMGTCRLSSTEEHGILCYSRATKHLFVGGHGCIKLCPVIRSANFLEERPIELSRRGRTEGTETSIGSISVVWRRSCLMRTRVHAVTCGLNRGRVASRTQTGCPSSFNVIIDLIPPLDREPRHLYSLLRILLWFKLLHCKSLYLVIVILIITTA